MNKSTSVLVFGRFNVLHLGHLRLLRSAKDYGDRLIVAIESDYLAGAAAHLSEDLRLEGVQSHGLVDEAFISYEPIDQLIARLRPDVVVKGKEHELRDNIELNVLKSYGGRLVFSSGEAIFSSLDFIRKEYQFYDPSTIKLPMHFLRNHNIDNDRLINVLKNFSKLKVCILGDLIVDEYITCEPLGMSQEDPTIVVTPVDSVRFIGGAGIVAAHAAGLGANVRFFSVSGNDSVRDFAQDSLRTAGVEAYLMEDSGRPTTLKQRYRSKGKSLLRVSHLHQEPISSGLQASLLVNLEKALSSANLLVFSDFNYGCLPQAIVDKVTEIARGYGVFMAADSQSSSQLGDVGRFKGMDLITPTEREARISTRNSEDGLVVMADILRVQSGAKNILLKLGEEGLLIHAVSNQTDGWLTDRIEALNSSPKDVAGAGDSLLITSAMAMACGATIWEAACLGSLAAAVQVGRIGNTPLQAKEILRELT